MSATFKLEEKGGTHWQYAGRVKWTQVPAPEESHYPRSPEVVKRVFMLFELGEIYYHTKKTNRSNFQWGKGRESQT